MIELGNNKLKIGKQFISNHIQPIFPTKMIGFIYLTKKRGGFFKKK
jgi:hypothetical protein